MASLVYQFMESDTKRYYADLNGMVFMKAIKNKKNINEVNLVCTISGDVKFQKSFILYGIHNKIIPYIYNDMTQMINFLDEYIIYLESKYNIKSSSDLQYIIKGIEAIMYCIKEYNCIFFSFENVSQPVLIGDPVYL